MNDETRQLYVQTFSSKSAKFSRRLLAASVATIVASQVSAQTPPPLPANTGTLQEVVVTAQRRSEEALNVPISITAISSDQLEKNNVQQLGDVAAMTPSLRFDNAGPQSQPTIRGVGTAVAVAGGSSNVGIYTDGFYSPNPVTADSDLLNVQSVQVLKGPQGTLFGRNSTGGAILVTTKDPSSKPSADIKASYGNYNTQRYQIYATGGPTEDLAFDIAGLERKSDGYVKNIATHSDTDGAYDNSSVRLGVKWQATDRISALLRYMYSDTEDNTFVAANAFEKDGQTYATAAAYGLPVATKWDEVSNGGNGFKPAFTGRSSATQLTVKVDFDTALLTSYTQYRDERGRTLLDFDMAPSEIYHYKFDNVDTIFTQEFLLTSTSDSRLQWTTGLFYFENGSFYENNQGATPTINNGSFTLNGGSGVDVKTIAAYGDATYELRDDLYLTAGLRYSKDTLDNAYFLNPELDPITNLPDGNLIRTDVPSVDDHQFTPRVVLRYKPNESSSVYASYTEGYKSAILNVGGGQLDGINVKPEKIKAYEVGYKYRSGPAMVDVSTFYYDYKDLQVASYVGATSVIHNAANSTVYGIDGQTRYAFSEHWEANLGLAYVHTRYDSFDQSQVWSQCLDPLGCGVNKESAYLSYAPGYIDASGNEMQRAPKLTGTLGLNYRTDLAGGALAVSGSLYHTSDFYFDSSNAYKQDAYDLLNMRADWTDASGRYSVGVFGNNLTDKHYRNQALPQQLGTLSTWGAPRTYGMSLGLHF